MSLIAARHRPELVQSGSGSAAVQEIVLVGAHGGAGVSTLAILLPPAWDMGAIRPARRDCAALRTGGRPLVLVTRNTVPASASATASVGALTSQGGTVAVLAVVSDGLPEPGEAAYRFRLLAPGVGAIVRVPFVAALRAASDPAVVDLPRRARRALAEIRSVAQAHACTPPPGKAS
jgi:hypothetical protein